MSTFEGAVLNQIVGVARNRKLEPAALLAVAEVESAGKSLEVDGKTPRLLFERHVFYRELVKAKKSAALSNAVAMGLANSTWQPSTQYKDQGTSAQRLALFAKAKVVDEECAIRACSWGVGQTMGFLAEELKFPNARAMLAYMVRGGIPAQVSLMVREIERKRLGGHLNDHNWAAFAYSYNGPGYKTNRYDTKMAAAYLKWRAVEMPKVTDPIPEPEPTPGGSPDRPVPRPPVNGNTGGVVVGTGGLLAAIYAFFHSNQQALIFLAIAVAVAVTTFFVIRRRRAHAELNPSVGSLADVDTESSAAIDTAILPSPPPPNILH